MSEFIRQTGQEREKEDAEPSTGNFTAGELAFPEKGTDRVSRGGEHLELLISAKYEVVISVENDSLSGYLNTRR